MRDCKNEREVDDKRKLLVYKMHEEKESIMDLLRVAFQIEDDNPDEEAVDIAFFWDELGALWREYLKYERAIEELRGE